MYWFGKSSVRAKNLRGEWGGGGERERIIWPQTVMQCTPAVYTYLIPQSTSFSLLSNRLLHECSWKFLCLQFNVNYSLYLTQAAKSDLAGLEASNKSAINGVFSSCLLLVSFSNKSINWCPVLRCYQVFTPLPSPPAISVHTRRKKFHLMTYSLTKVRRCSRFWRLTSWYSGILFALLAVALAKDRAVFCVIG